LGLERMRYGTYPQRKIGLPIFDDRLTLQLITHVVGKGKVFHVDRHTLRVDAKTAPRFAQHQNDIRLCDAHAIDRDICGLKARDGQLDDFDLCVCSETNRGVLQHR
jgi:hypothetical protein